MKINANELLLMNKKIRFGEGQEIEKPAQAIIPEAGNDKPQTGLNALMFKGMNNLVSNPELAQEVGAMNEDAPRKLESAEGYITPYKSNIAFQGKANKFKTFGMAALMALMSFGATSTLTSCGEDTVIESYEKTETNINIDLSILQTLIDEIKGLREDMAKRDEANAQKYDQILTMFNQVISLMNQQQLSQDKFFSLFLSNQQVMIDIMVANGMKQDEANKKLDDILAAVESGKMTVQQALQQITDLLGGIKDLLADAIAKFTEYTEKMLEKQDELINTNKAGFEELIKDGKISNDKLDKLTQQSDSLIILGNKASEERNAIKEAIEKANLDNNANFEAVVSALNVNKDALIAALKQMGYTQAQIIKMTAKEIKDAINNNTQMTAKGNELLVQITKQLQALPELVEQGSITNSQLKEFYELYKEATKEGGEFNQTTIDKLEQLANKLDSIQGTLDEINKKLQTLVVEVQAFRTDYVNDKKDEMNLLKEVIKENRFQTSVLENMQKTQENMDKNLAGLKSNTDELLSIAKDDTKFKQLMEAISNIQGGGSSSNITKADLEAMFKSLGITLGDAINMSQSDLIKAIENFQKTYIETEQKQTEELQTINSKLDDLKIFAGLDKDEIVAAIKDAAAANSKENADITKELQTVNAKLDKLQATVDAMFKQVGSMASNMNTYFTQFNNQFNKALGYLENIDKNVSNLNAAMTVANSYLKNLDTPLSELKKALEEIKDAMGENAGSVDMDKLEKMWKEHDEANFNKYKELLKNMDITVDVNTDKIEDLLDSIDGKMDLIKDNSDILNKIYNKIKDIDFTSPDYSNKLDEILEVLKNFKCNCECGKNNEGILGDLDKILG